MRQLIYLISNLFYPRICQLCRIKSSEPDQSICEACLERFHKVELPTCVKCGGSNDGILEVCSDCSDLNAAWDQGFTVWKYKSGARELIHEFKYHNRTELTRFIAENMAVVIKKSSPLSFDFITFVPIHWFKKILRGYNQSELLANELSLLLRVPCKKSVDRVKFARQQAMLNKQARLKNIKNVFKLKSDSFPFWKDKHILVVDDVFTTGATFKEMTRQLRLAGVASITIISIARG